MDRKKIAVLGLGHIGEYVMKNLISNSWKHISNRELSVAGYDLKTGHDLSNDDVLEEIITGVDAVVAATPFFLNKTIALKCAIHGVAYFDLTESNEVRDYILSLTKEHDISVPMIPQCGLAPGMVSIIANDIASKFDSVKSIAIRVGALPSVPNNQMGYLLTWNTEGLINEYIHPCKALVDGKLTMVEPLEDLEPVQFNGILLEAANTSGGLGSLAESWQGKAEQVTYKTLRYPGHWNYMKFLKNDLNLKENFNKFVEIFNSSVPHTDNDKVFILIKVVGAVKNRLFERAYHNIVEGDGEGCDTAIQKTTGAGVMAVVDAWAKGHLSHLKGLVKQEELPIKHIRNDYAACYKY